MYADYPRAWLQCVLASARTQVSNLVDTRQVSRHVKPGLARCPTNTAMPKMSRFASYTCAACACSAPRLGSKHCWRSHEVLTALARGMSGIYTGSRLCLIKSLRCKISRRSRVATRPLLPRSTRGTLAGPQTTGSILEPVLGAHAACVTTKIGQFHQHGW